MQNEASFLDSTLLSIQKMKSGVHFQLQACTFHDYTTNIYMILLYISNPSLFFSLLYTEPE